MESNKVCVNFKCRHCSEMLQVESQSSGLSSKFWFRTGKIWSRILNKHIVTNHASETEKLDIKSDWEQHFEKGIIFLKERDPQKEVQLQLQQILDTLGCKLCEFVAEDSYQPGRNFLARHYCTEHFSKPMTELVEKEIENNFCRFCNKKFAFGSSTERLLHLGHKHAALYDFLREDSNIDLTPFIEKEVIVKEKEVFSCKECEKVFNKKHNFKAHMVYHNEERLFPCKVCEKTFKTKRDCDVHNRIHSGYQPHKCSFCEKRFSNNGAFFNHKQRYHTEGAYFCKACKTEFTTKWDLNVHETNACT